MFAKQCCDNLVSAIFNISVIPAIVGKDVKYLFGSFHQKLRKAWYLCNLRSLTHHFMNTGYQNTNSPIRT